MQEENYMSNMIEIVEDMIDRLDAGRCLLDEDIAMLDSYEDAAWELLKTELTRRNLYLKQDSNGYYVTADLDELRGEPESE